MGTPKVLVIGGNFAGLTAALSIKSDLQHDVDVTVVSKTKDFLFTPSLIWLPFGKRKKADITFPVAPTFENAMVEFKLGEATKIDPESQKVETTAGTFDYDYLVVATGYVNNFDTIPGLGLESNAFSITWLEGAEEAAVGWTRFLNDPGPVVVGATAGAACFGAAYEFVFNIAYQLKKHGLKKKVPITYVTAEPFAGHFGIGGLPGGEKMLGTFFGMSGIEAITDVAIEEVVPNEMRLKDGRKLPFKYGMVVPPFKGAEVVKSAPFGDEKGFVAVEDTYQAKGHDNVYAVGIAAAVNVPWATANPVGIPKTGFPTETMAHTAAKNIASQIRGETPSERKDFGDIPAICVMDAGNNGVIILADKMLPPRKHGVMIPGPQSHAAKIAFEKYFLWKSKHGYVNLP